MLPNSAKFGEPPLVEITFFVSPFAKLASILMSSPGPVGMFLICNAAITEPPHLVSGCPEISERLVGNAVAGGRTLEEPFTSCPPGGIWDQPHPSALRLWTTTTGERVQAG